MCQRKRKPINDIRKVVVTEKNENNYNSAAPTKRGEGKESKNCSQASSFFSVREKEMGCSATCLPTFPLEKSSNDNTNGYNLSTYLLPFFYRRLGPNEVLKIAEYHTWGFET